jgi:DNA recombination protein Rad52
MTPEIKEELNKPLNKAAIATRKNYSGKGELSYIETHHAIREANTIFGFDGWSRETVQVERVATQPYQSKYGDGMIAVSYMARVRITVGNVVREGCGYGDGQAKEHQAYTAHELAIKEAESDATKRALMTFGDRFGLVLYEKDRDKREERIETRPMPSIAPDPNDLFKQMKDAMSGCVSLGDMKSCWADIWRDRELLTPDLLDQITAHKDEVKAKFTEPAK